MIKLDLMATLNANGDIDLRGWEEVPRGEGSLSSYMKVMRVGEIGLHMTGIYEPNPPFASISKDHATFLMRCLWDLGVRPQGLTLEIAAAGAGGQGQ